MLRQERYEDPENALLIALEGWQAGLWTALPAIIESVDLGKMTCTAQPAIKGIWRLKDGSTKTVTLPLCLDVPIQFPSGGGFTLTFPFAKGDEGLLVFASRCIDAWWQNGDVQPQAELRMHDLSDGFFIPGFRSQPRMLSNISANSTDLRTDAGDVFVRVKAAEIDVQVKDDTHAVFTDGQIVLTAKDSSITLKEGEIDLAATTIKLNGTTLVGGGAQFVKLADGSNATKLKSS